MKKLLLSVFAFCGVLTVSAFNVGDYMYTTDAKFKITGENQVQNGSFTDVTGAGWTNAAGEAVSAASWALTEGAGPNGGNAMISMSADEGNVLAQVFPSLNPGTYAISYWVKGADASGIILNSPAPNYGGIYVNTDASLTTVGRIVSNTDAFTQEWSQVKDTVTINAGEFLVIYFDRFAVGTSVADFEVHEIQQVFDERALANDIAYIKTLLAREDFPNKLEDEGFPDIVTAIETALADPANSMIGDVESIAEMEAFISGSYEPVKQNFLDANSADMLNYISYGDISSWPKFNNGDGKTAQGDWKFSGSTMRWGHGSGAVHGNLAYPGNYDLMDGTCMIEKAGLDAGTYIFALDVQASKYNKTKIGADGYYTYDYNVNAYGGKLFFGGDTVVVDTLPNRTYQRYYIVAKLAEGDTLRAGFRFPGFEVGAGGGVFYFKNAELRLVGSSKAEQDLKVLVGNIKTAQNSFKVMLDSAIVVSGKTAQYPWGMQGVRDSIALAQPRYDASLLKIAADGTVLDVTLEADSEYPAELNTYMGYARTAMQNLYALNAPIDALKEEIRIAKEDNLNNPDWANATATAKAQLEADVAAGQALIDAIATIDDPATAQVEADKMTAQTAVIVASVVNFQMSAATYANPASVTVPNSDFTGQTKKALPKAPWTGVISGSIEAKHFSYGTWNVAGRDENGRGYVSGWRGQVATPKAKVSQEITITAPGVYELAAFVYGANENNKNCGYFTILLDEETGASIDTTFTNSTHRIFFGPTGTPDSTLTHSQFLDDRHRPSRYSAYYVKTTSEPEVVELGFHSRDEGVDGNGPNIFGFGGVDLNFAADATQYEADLTADLSKYVAEAQAILATEAGAAEVNKWMAYKLNRLIADAAAATTLNQKMNTIHRLKENIARMNLLVTGIEGVEAETVVDADAKGVYSITGVKLGNQLKSLEKGLYIINGKKYIVK